MAASNMVTPGCKVLDAEVLYNLQLGDMEDVAKHLRVIPGVAELLLRHYSWSVLRVKHVWDNARDHELLLQAVDMTTKLAAEPVKFSTDEERCHDCRNLMVKGDLMSPGCNHYYCHGCWLMQVDSGKDGPAPLRCRVPSCNVPVVRELVAKHLRRSSNVHDERGAYERFLLRSYVENCGGRRAWCPGKCGLAAIFDGAATEERCPCGQVISKPRA